MIALIVAFVVAVASVPVLARLAGQVNLVDQPDGRKTHHGEVPLVGGLAICAALVVAFLAGSVHWGTLWYVVLGSAVLLILGVLDDHRIVRSVWKFVVQDAVALLVVIGEAGGIEAVGHSVFGHTPWADALSLAIAWLFIAGFINAFNMVDGVDGLAGSLALSMAVAFLLVGGKGVVGANLHTMLLALIGASIGFLVFNARFPWFDHGWRVFLGDSGSMVLGLLIAWSAIHLAGTTGVARHNTGVLAWIVAYPVADTLVVMTLRVVRGRHPFTPDRLHFHHLLLARGLSVNTVVFFINAICWLGIGYAVLGHWLGLSNVTLVLSIFAMVFMHMLFALWLWAGRGAGDRQGASQKLSQE